MKFEKYLLDILEFPADCNGEQTHAIRPGSYHVLPVSGPDNVEYIRVHCHAREYHPNSGTGPEVDEITLSLNPGDTHQWIVRDNRTNQF